MHLRALNSYFQAQGDSGWDSSRTLQRQPFCLGGGPGPSAEGLAGSISLWQQLLRGT